MKKIILSLVLGITTVGLSTGCELQDIEDIIVIDELVEVSEIAEVDLGIENIDNEVIVVEYEVDESDFLEEKEFLTEENNSSELTQAEIDGLLLMREEEKLARDLYLVLGEKWDVKSFLNISRSEQTHTDAIKFLLERYDIADPVTNDTVGIFESEELTAVYDTLLEKGSLSLVDAIEVGIIVEDLDIKDLQDLLETTDSQDIIDTYNNLLKGSRNHLRAYVGNFERYGKEYIPQYISEEDYLSIINSAPERGRM